MSLQRLGLGSQVGGLLGATVALVLRCDRVAFGDLGTDDLFDVGFGEVAARDLGDA